MTQSQSVLAGLVERKFWTDYPIIQLGDIAGEEAPVREVTLMGYDGDKYVSVLVDGIETSFKAGYLYLAPHRYGEGPSASHAFLQSLEAL